MNCFAIDSVFNRNPVRDEVMDTPVFLNQIRKLRIENLVYCRINGVRWNLAVDASRGSFQAAYQEGGMVVLSLDSC